jgi:dolichol kinase
MLTVISWPAAIVASVTGGLAESLPSPSEDNLAVPLGAAVAAYLANGAAA